MTTENSQLFQTLVQGFSFWMKHGKELCVGDSMVVKLDEPYKGHMQTWKTKITLFFIHDFYGDRKVFFQNKYYNTTRSTSSSFVALQHSYINMIVSQPRLKQWLRNDIKPAHLLICTNSFRCLW
jgi:hypothetical protein